MLEEESGGAPLFSAKMLSQMIHFYGGTLQGMFTRYLEESLDLFASHHRDMRVVLGENPLDTVTRMAQHNMQMWTDMQQKFFRTTDSSDYETTGDSRTKDDKKTTS